MGVRPRTVAVGVLIGAVAWSACARGDTLRSEAVAASEPVTFESSDGTALEGRLFGPDSATAGVVLAHMTGSDQSAWYVDAQRLADDGYRVLTYDARGTCPGGEAGCSAGESDPSRFPSDMAAAVDLLRRDGAERIGLVGASMGGTTALALAGQAPGGVEAVVTLSAPMAFSGLAVSSETLAGLPTATLFIAGNGDTQAAADAETMQTAAAPPKDLQIVTSDDHGTDLLTGNAGGRVRDLLDAWLARYLVAPEAGS